jgi:hypothetical protein
MIIPEDDETLHQILNPQPYTLHARHVTPAEDDETHLDIGPNCGRRPIITIHNCTGPSKIAGRVDAHSL